MVDYSNNKYILLENSDGLCLNASPRSHRLKFLYISELLLLLFFFAVVDSKMISKQVDKRKQLVNVTHGIVDILDGKTF